MKFKKVISNDLGFKYEFHLSNRIHGKCIRYNGKTRTILCAGIACADMVGNHMKEINKLDKDEEVLIEYIKDKYENAGEYFSKHSGIIANMYLLIEENKERYL